MVFYTILHFLSLVGGRVKFPGSPGPEHIR